MIETNNVDICAVVIILKSNQIHEKSIEDLRILFVYSDKRILFLIEEIKRNLPSIDTLYIKINPKSPSFLINMLLCYFDLIFKFKSVHKISLPTLYLNTVRRPAFIKKLSSKVAAHISSMELKPNLVVQWQGLFAPYNRSIEVPFIIITDNYTDPPNSLSQKDMLRGWSTIYNEYFYNLQKELYQNAICIFTLSKWCREGIVKEYQINPEKVAAIGWGAAKEINNNFFPIKKEKTILAIGTDYKAKGLDVLLDTAKYLNDFSITIVGRDSTYDKRKHIPDNVHVTNTLSDVELVQLYSESEFFFAFSEFEPSAHALWEAQAYGCIIIGYNAFGIPETVVNRITGLLLDTRDPVLIAREIKQLYQDSSSRIQMQKEAMANYQKNGQWSNVSNKLIERLKLCVSTL